MKRLFLIPIALLVVGCSVTQNSSEKFVQNNLPTIKDIASTTLQNMGSEKFDFDNFFKKHMGLTGGICRRFFVASHFESSILAWVSNDVLKLADVRSLTDLAYDLKESNPFLAHFKNTHVLELGEVTAIVLLDEYNTPKNALSVLKKLNGNHLEASIAKLLQKDNVVKRVDRVMSKHQKWHLIRLPHLANGRKIHRLKDYVKFFGQGIYRGRFEISIKTPEYSDLKIEYCEGNLKNNKMNYLVIQGTKSSNQEFFKIRDAGLDGSLREFADLNEPYDPYPEDAYKKVLESTLNYLNKNIRLTSNN